MNKTVYVVECGEYSSKYVAALFSDSDSAAAYARANEGHVMEYDLDEPLSENETRQLRRGEHRYQVSMDINGLNAQANESWEPLEKPVEYLHARIDRDGTPRRINGQCWATSETHAIKIINDRRTQWIANGPHVGLEDRLAARWFVVSTE